PKDSADVCAIVKWVKEQKTLGNVYSITPRSAGTCMAGGYIGESIIMDFTRYMNLLGHVEPVDEFTITPKYPNANPVVISGHVSVMPGCYYRDFENATLEKGLILPCYTASKSINAVGGMVGNNSAGEKTLQYGKTEDYISELKVVFADGYEYVVKPLTKKELYNKIAQVDFEGSVYKEIFNLIKENEMVLKSAKPQVSKNSAGYYLWNVFTNKEIKHLERSEGSDDEIVFDLCKLIVGSQGTLGIVTEIKFNLVRTKPVSKLAVIFMKDLSRLGELVDTILPYQPESIESYDDATMKLAIKFFPDFLKKKGVWGMFKFMWSFWPEAIMMLVGGMPKLILLVEFAGTEQGVVNKQATQLVNAIKPFKFKTRITKNKNDADKYWDIRRESFALLRKHIKDKHTAPFIDDIIVPPQSLPEFLPKLQTILNQYPITYTIAGHAGNGNFHIIPLMDFSDSNTSEIIIELSKKVYDLVLEYRGSTTAEHNDGIIRTPYLTQMFGEYVVSLFQKTKNIFDPQNILNPGKKVPLSGGGQAGSVEYIRTHIIKEKHETSHKV
ncbi:MAG: FAD-binding oxidoreductase, partial [Minisyncoccia bacterium]